MFTQGLQGLGLTVTVTTKFDPQRIRERLKYWIESTVDEMAIQARADIRGAGMIPNEGGRAGYLKAALDRGLSNLVNWSTTVPVPKGPNAAKTYGMMAAKMVIGIVFPWVGIGMALSSFLGKKKKKRMGIPWNALYGAALPYAQTQTKAEELQRIAQEVVEIAEIKKVTGEKRSAEASLFKMPEGITSISRGALVISPVGQPIIKSITRKK